MPLKQPTEDEFEVTDIAVIHKPTGARWWWRYPGTKSLDLGHDPGQLGSVPPNGDDYNVGAVKDMAMFLLGTLRS